MTKPIATHAIPNRQTLPVEAVFNPFALAKAKETAIAEDAALAGSTIDDDADARAANAELLIRIAELDAAELMLSETLAPFEAGIARVKLLFQPTLEPARRVVATLRRMLEGYELAKRAASRAALGVAAKAATLPGSKALHTALAAAADAAPTQLEGTSFVARWKVKRLALDLLPFNPLPKAPPNSHFWLPDEKKINAIGRAHKGDDPPFVPGVIWEESLSSRVRRG